ncbi:hypothetical protein BS78_06G054000 [Paspalum vaginatum]|nr:hypothetical protein BS78_06G054000 [Paspalum vaginatum]
MLSRAGEHLCSFLLLDSFCCISSIQTVRTSPTHRPVSFARQSGLSPLLRSSDSCLPSARNSHECGKSLGGRRRPWLRAPSRLATRSDRSRFSLKRRRSW